MKIAGQMHLSAQFHGNAAPALKLVGARGTVWDTPTLVVVVETGGAGHVIVGFGAATEALVVATLPLVCTGKPTLFRAN